MKRKLAHGNCANCGVDENHTSLWRTGLDKERLCNACGLYVQTHGKSRPTSHFGGRRPRNKDKDGGGTSRDTTPAGTPRGTPRNSPAPPTLLHTSSSDGGSSSDLEPSPPHVHAQPVGGSNSGTSTSGAGGERQSRAPRRPHQNHPGGHHHSSSSAVRSGSASSRPRVKLPRAPPRPQSAPPAKHRSRFNPGGGGSASDHHASPPPSAVAPSKTKSSRKTTVPAPTAAATAVERELAHDVLSQGQWYRVPEKTIRLDFWSKIGLDPGRPSAAGHGGTSMLRTSSMPAFSPREAALLTPDGSRSSFFSPSSATDDSFSQADGDFSDSENTFGKRERYLGPLFGGGGGSTGHEAFGGGAQAQDLAALDRMGHITLASSPHGTPKRRPASLRRPSAPSSPRLTHGLPASPSASSPPAAALDYFAPPPPTSVRGKLSPERALGDSLADGGHAAKRIRSTSPASPPTSPKLVHATPPPPAGAPSSSSGPSSPTGTGTSGGGNGGGAVQHPSPLLHHSIAAAAASIPRSSSPLRFSSTADKLAHAPLPRSSLGSPALSHAVPVQPLEDSAMADDGDDDDDVTPPGTTTAGGADDGDAKPPPPPPTTTTLPASDSPLAV